MSKLVELLKDKMVQEVLVNEINGAIDIPFLPESVEDKVFSTLMQVIISVVDSFDYINYE